MLRIWNYLRTAWSGLSWGMKIIAFLMFTAIYLQLLAVLMRAAE